MDKRASGRAGEDTAAAYLASLGYDVLQRNYYTRYGEIDIIANDGDWLVFTEVRKKKKCEIWNRSTGCYVKKN